jgi:hypothetical protein
MCRDALTPCAVMLSLHVPCALTPCAVMLVQMLAEMEATARQVPPCFEEPQDYATTHGAAYVPHDLTGVT